MKTVYMPTGKSPSIVKLNSSLDAFTIFNVSQAIEKYGEETGDLDVYAVDTDHLTRRADNNDYTVISQGRGLQLSVLFVNKGNGKNLCIRISLLRQEIMYLGDIADGDKRLIDEIHRILKVNNETK